MSLLSIEQATHLLYAEGLALDERRWEDWLELYLPEARYWVPSWKSESETTNDPDTELSLIYYETRDGLEDRIWRLKSGLSVASNPLRRTAHTVSNIQVVETAEAEGRVKATGVVHVHDPKRKISTAFFGLYDYQLRLVDGQWRIAAKTVKLLNDNIPAVLDIYML